ncbi:lactate dehydrogenase [Pandoraea faecigallinarum]|uniref:Lactate dehydrogenase n=1 Tax=Pandoraea faecigallinarum TaxID=656179 RepID=A0A0H3WWU8_9BURK|nr:Ldh family oxidoreductase [Pandoraea faecigallinarum]AKM32212.1 lactate dehydrogenase [Pandoraea faecigallinarum]
MRIPLKDAVDFGKQLLCAQGVPDDIALDVAQHLVESDRVGYASHGLSILPTYRKVLEDDQVNPNGRPSVLTDHGNLLLYEGNRGFGQHVGKFVVERAIARAFDKGVAILTLRNSHHLGRMGQYGEMAAHQGLVFMAFTNVTNRQPMVAPFGGSEPRLTTNPLCFAGPLPNNRPPLVVDMATSAIAINKARVLAAEGKQAPPGSLIDGYGNPSTDPNVLFTEPFGALLPFGGHKGYALGIVTELLAGVLSGGGTIQPEHPRAGVATNNMFAIVLNPQVDFAATWRSHEVEAFIDYLTSCPPQPGFDRVQYPGEYEAENRKKHHDHIDLTTPIWESLLKMATDLGVATPRTL